MSKIFIGHSSANNASAVALARWLAANGWGDHFLDVSPTRGLRPGQRWQEALKAAADRCEAVIFLISPSWLDSKWCLAEFLLAKTLGKTIFGVLVEAAPHESLPTELLAEFQLCDLVTGTLRTIFRVSLDGIVPETEVSFAAAGLEKLRLGLATAGLDPATFFWPPPEDPERLPYRGLRALEPMDAAVFFGRGAELVRGLDALRAMRAGNGERLLVVLGASGSGKSSFLRAGLLPRLRRDDRHFLTLPAIRPEDAVLGGAHGLVASLEGACRAAGVSVSRAALRSKLQGADGLREVLAELRQSAAPLEAGWPAPTVIIPIDQGEELFNPAGRVEAEAFLSLLRSVLADAPAPGGAPTPVQAIAVVGIRSESYVHLQTEPFLESVRSRLFPLNPIAKAEFKAIVEGPAAIASDAGRRVVFEPGLVQLLLHDAEGPDALPLLAFTLERLFVEYGGSGRLRQSDYERLGGIRGAVEAAIDNAFDAPHREPAVPSQRAERERLLRRAFVPWLATVDPDTGERRRRVAHWGDFDAEARPLLERLVAARVLVRDVRAAGESAAQETVVEIAHEALLRQWAPLALWLDGDADDLQRMEAVRRAAAEWARNERSPAWLVHAGERLAAAEALRSREDLDRVLGDLARSYLAACAHQEAQRQEREAESARRMNALAVDALRAQSRYLANASQMAAASGDTGLAVRLALEALPHSVSDGGRAERPNVPEAWVALHRAVDFNRERLVLRGHRDKVQALAFSPDGTLVLSASWDGSARIWNAHTGDMAFELTGHTSRVEFATFSADGQFVATGSRKEVNVWNARTGEAVATLEASAERLAFTRPDASEIVTYPHIGKGPVVVWDVARRKPRLAVPAGERILDVRASCMLAVTQADHGPAATPPFSLTVWDLRTGSSRVVSHPSWRNDPWWSYASVLLSPRGDVMAASFNHVENPPAQLLSVSDGAPLVTLGPHRYLLGSEFSPDGRHLLTEGSPAQLWDTETGEVTATLEGGGDVSRVSFSTDSSRFVTWSRDDGVVRVWSTRSGKVLVTLPAHRDSVHTPVIRQEDERCLTTSSDNTVRVWDVRPSGAFGFGQGLPALFTAALDTDRGEIVTVHEDASVHVFGKDDGRELRHFATGSRYVTGADILPARRLVAIMEREGRTRVHDIDSGREIATMLDPENTVSCIAITRDGAQIVTGTESGTLRQWDLRSGGLVRELRGHTKSPHIRFSRDGRQMLSSSSDGLLHKWDLATGACLRTLSFRAARLGLGMAPVPAALATKLGLGHDEGVLVDHIDPRRAAAAGLRQGDVILRWNGTPVDTAWVEAFGEVMRRSRSVFAPEIGLGAGESVSIDFLRENERQEMILVAREEEPDGYLRLRDVDADLRRAILSAEQWLEVWDLDEERRLSQFSHVPHQISLEDAALCPDGTRVVTAGDNKIVVWDIGSGKALPAQMAPTSRIAFCPDGTRFVTVKGSVAVLFDLESRQPLTLYPPLEDSEAIGGAVMVGSDGTQMIVLPPRGPGLVWQLLPVGDELLRVARSQVPQPLTSEERARFFLSESDK